MKTILITKDPKVAKYADESGVDRVMVDLEILGKKERQGHLNTVISEHTIEDVKIVKKQLNKAELLVRINPINKNSKEEIESVINEGANVVMLPMFTTKEEVETFVHLVDKRAITYLLLETPQALVRIQDIVNVDGVDEIHIGLNDLHLGLNLKFMFELLSGGIVEYLSKIILNKNIVFGFGGIARIGQGTLDSSLILSEHYRLHSKRVILSRDFKGGKESYEDLIKIVDLKKEVLKIHNLFKILQNCDKKIILENQELLKSKIDKIIAS